MSSHPIPGSRSRRDVLRSFAALAATSVFSGCSSSAYHITAAASGALPVPSNPSSMAPAMPLLQPTPAGALQAASITVTGGTVGSFCAGFSGLAYEKQTLCGSLFSASNTSLVRLCTLLGPAVLCIGGASVDQMVWAPAGDGQTAGQISPSDVDALAGFLHATGWSCVYGVNLGGSATGATNPDLAAAEAAYVSRKLGPLLRGIQIGNACENYGAPGSYYAGSWSVEAFESLWKTYRNAILAAAPLTPIVGPGAASNVDSWTIPFGEFVTNSRIAALTQQYTRSAAITSTPDALVEADPALSGDLLQLRYGAQSIDVPFRISSCGSGAIPGVSDSYASALWAIDTIFTCAQNGAEGVNFACGDTPTGAPISSMEGVVDSVQPAFYGMLLAGWQAAAICCRPRSMRACSTSRHSPSSRPTAASVSSSSIRTPPGTSAPT